MAATLDAILNLSRCSRVTKVHPADSENGPPRPPKTVEKKLFRKCPGSVTISHVSTGLLPLLLRITTFQWFAFVPCMVLRSLESSCSTTPKGGATVCTLQGVRSNWRRASALARGVSGDLRKSSSLWWSCSLSLSLCLCLCVDEGREQKSRQSAVMPKFHLLCRFVVHLLYDKVLMQYSEKLEGQLPKIPFYICLNLSAYLVCYMHSKHAQ